MSEKTQKRRRKRRHRARPRPQRQQQTRPDFWQSPFPSLEPEDRLSSLVDYRDIVADYDELVAEVGEETLQEHLDHFYFFLGSSNLLAEETEFQSVKLGIDPYDFLVYATFDFLTGVLDEKGSIWDPEGGLVKPYSHIVEHAISRYLTPALRKDLKRRCRRTARRLWGTSIGLMADAVEIALDDEGIPSIIITLLPHLFSSALVQSVLNMPEQFERDWEERDRSLDCWMEQIAAADFDQPAEEAIDKLVEAGTRAIPHLAHLFYDMDLDYDDYPIATALETVAFIPCQFSLHLLVEALLDDCDWSSEQAAELLAGMPDLACPYLAYALTVPGGPDWLTALWEYSLLGEMQCPGAFDILVEGLSYQGKSSYDSGVGQLSAAEGLLALGDERAIPILHDYLRNPQVDLTARDELLYLLLEDEDGHPWGAQIARDLTRGDLEEA